VRIPRALLSVCLMLLLAPTVRAAPTTQPAPQPIAHKPAEPAAVVRFEQQTLLVEKRTPATSRAATETTTSESVNAFDVRRVALALAVVVALIFLLRWIAKNLFAGSSAPRANGAIRVLSRMVVSPKQQVLLLQVGRRVVVVGDSGQQMSPLSEITDPDEIAALVGQISHDHQKLGGKRFSSLFGHARDPFEDQNAPDEPEEKQDIDSARGEIAGLMEKIRVVSTQFRRT
jgi:flagellar biogenesis protein FliO